MSDQSADLTNSAIVHRPYNSIRFRCKCGVVLTFPRSPSKGLLDVTYQGGLRKVVTPSTKEVHCSCGPSASGKKARCSHE